MLELTIVVAIMAVLSAITIPRYASAVDGYRLEAAAKRVIADIA